MGQHLPDKIDLADLDGRWYIHQSNFPMWLKGDKTSPTFNYTYLTDGKEPYLYDSVKFIKKGKVKSIDGYDYATNEQNTAFVWRGKGILRLIKSKWKFLYLDPQQQWGIIYFEKTLFTPSGYDVISRSPTFDAAQAQRVNELRAELGIEEELAHIAQKERY